MNASNDARSAEQDEASQDYGCAIAPVDTPGQHEETDRRDGDHRDHGGDSSQQCALKPADRGGQGTRSCRVLERILSERGSSRCQRAKARDAPSN